VHLVHPQGLRDGAVYIQAIQKVSEVGSIGGEGVPRRRYKGAAMSPHVVADDPEPCLQERWHLLVP
jgi:hypothetical protein